MQFSTAQIIAFCRVVLATVFLLAIFVDPSQPSAFPEYGYAILLVYAAIALLWLGVASTSWWLDYRLAGPAHVLDIAAFGAVVFMSDGYTSPFFTFSVFLLLSSSIRWSVRETVLTAFAVNVLFLGSGTLAQLASPLEIDIQRLMIRGSYLVVLSALFILFAFNTQSQRRARRWRPISGSAAREAGFIGTALSHVRERTSAERVIFAWRNVTELHSWIYTLDSEGLEDRRLPADAINWALAFDENAPYVFETAEGRHLLGDLRPVPKRLSEFQVRGLVNEQIGGGLALPIRVSDMEGTIFAVGIPRLSSDHLPIGAKLVDELTRFAEEASYFRMAQDAAEARVRILLARDLHDSVAQFLAGVSFRLEGAKRSGKSSGEMREDLSLFQDEIAKEQDDLNELIADLRGTAVKTGIVNLSVNLPSLIDRLSKQWGIKIALSCDASLTVSTGVEFELNQMIREGVANAVKHGSADAVEISLGQSEEWLELSIGDNGSGLPTGAPNMKLPRSLRERVEALGGRIALHKEAGTTIQLTLPRGGI